MKTRKTWEKLLGIFLAVVLILGMIPVAQLLMRDKDVQSHAGATPSKIYFTSTSTWFYNSARTAAYFFGGSSDATWVNCTYSGATDSDGHKIYEVSVPSGDYPKVIFSRFDPNETTNSFVTDWNQTGNLLIPTDGKNLFTQTGWSNKQGTGSWSTYTPSTVDPPVTADEYYVAGVSSLCGESWDADADKMTFNATKNRYELTFKNITPGTYEFKITDGTWNNSWGQDGGGNNYSFTIDAVSDVTVYFDATNKKTGVETKATGAVVTNNTFYADTLLVDYLNDDRIYYHITNGYATNNLGNQGTQDDSGSIPFSWLNYLISEANYTTPLYFGNLYFTNSRYGRLPSNDTNKISLKKWNEGANVAPWDEVGGEFDSCAQGLVYNKLVGGKLMDSNGQTELFYFNENANMKVTTGGSEVKTVTYYSGLKFPFESKVEGGVTTYSFDSATDDHVYYDFSDPYMKTTSSHVKDIHGRNGFFPLNKSGDSGDAVNYGFGLKFTIQFTVSDDGVIKTANGNKDVVFNFSGDDDVWVFIDDQLVLDMGGAHAKATGSINFRTLAATVNDAFDATLPQDTYVADGGGHRASVSSSAKTKNFSSISVGNDKTLADVFNAEYEANSPQVHTLTMFYMERGMQASNMSISFTMTPVPSGLTVNKDIANEGDINAGLKNVINREESITLDFSATYKNGVEKILFGMYQTIDKTRASSTRIPAFTTNGNTITTKLYGMNNDTYIANFMNSDGNHTLLAGTSFEITELDTVFKYDSTKTAWCLFDANKSYAPVSGFADANGKPVYQTGATAEFTMGTLDERKSYSYSLNFRNTILLGQLTVKKVSQSDAFQSTAFKFQVALDLDGSGNNFSSTYYQLTYTVGSNTFTTDANGCFTLTPGQTAVFKGIPQGATYKVIEVTTANDAWNAVTTNGTGTISNESSDVVVTNTPKEVSAADKFIYIETNTFNKNQVVNYYIKPDGTNALTNLSITAIDANGVSAEVDTSKKFIKVSSATPGVTGTFNYSGTASDGTRVSGKLTVYTFQATKKNYVFDFGLASILTATSDNKVGLFQEGYWAITGVNTSAKWNGFTPIKNTDQVQLTPTNMGTIYADGSSVGQLEFKPIDYMSKIAEFEYEVIITAPGKTYKADDPETGTSVTGYINIMPANTVYYEDNFKVGTGSSVVNKITFSGVTQNSSAPNGEQSNDYTTNYGKDIVYGNGVSMNSNNGATLLTNKQTAIFTFTGTGFDIISRTTGTSGGMKVEVFKGSSIPTGTDVKADYLYYVDNMYKHGALYQVPVISVMGLSSTPSTYTVQITALDSYNGLEGVYIDGIRIYNPLNDTSGYIPAERGVYFTELRDMYFSASTLNGTFTLANFKAGNLSLVKYNAVTGKVEYADAEDKPLGLSWVEDYFGTGVNTVNTLADVYMSGPNNEMYLPKGHGIQFTFTAITADNTLQIGAKAVGSVGKISVYVNDSWVMDIDLSTDTDMYYDLTEKLKGLSGKVAIINASDSDNFVSLTTVKCTYSLS